MIKVNVEQLRQRLALVSHRRQHFEFKSAQSHRLALHETWRHSYLARPYLIGAPEERVAERFRNIFLNVMEIGSNGKIRPVPMEQTDEFMQVFTHMLEEYGVRAGGMPPPDIIQSAGEPILKYFEHGVPIGVTMFEGYTPPTKPFLVKYGKRQFLEPMFRTGELRLANAGLYNDARHLAAVRDDETSRTFFIPTYKERSAGKDHLYYQGNRIEFADDDIVLPLVFDDYYLFSLCENIHYRMPTDFDADAAIIIKSPEIFKQRLISNFLAHFNDWIPMEGKVTYYDPYRDYTKFKTPEMAKHFGYAYQKEFRIAFRPRNSITTNLEPLFLSVGSMKDYADFVSL